MGTHRLIALFAALALVAPTAAGAVPSDEAGAMTDLTGTATGLVVSPDGRYVAATSRSGGGVAIWDTRALSDGAVTPAVCGSAASLAWVSTTAGAERVFVGCDEGEVYIVDLSTSSVPPVATVSEPVTLNTALGDVVALVHAPGDGVVFAVVQNGTMASLHSISATADGGTDGFALGLALTATISEAAIGESGTPMILARSDGYLVRYARSGDSFAAGTSFPLLPLGQITGLAVSSWLDLLLVADSTNDEVWAYTASSPGLGIAWGGGFDAPAALGLGDANSAPVVWVATSDATAWGIDGTDQSELADIELGGATPALIAGVREADAAVYVASSDGSIRILSDLPVLTPLQVSPDSITEGEEFTLTFTSSEDVAYEVRVGGDGTEGSGDELSTGDAVADEEVSLTFGSDDLTSEGENRLFVYATGAMGVGVDSISVTLDTPPGSLGTPTLGSGDQRLSVFWTATDETDIDFFEVYLSDAAFDADALPTFDVTTDDGAPSFPVQVDAGEAEEEQSYSIEGLVNGTTYWVAVRATDVGGQIGPLSEVVSGSPAATCGAAECADDPGCSCGASLSPSRHRGGLLAVGLLLLAVLPRRRRR
jgi:hypothetical protein